MIDAAAAQIEQRALAQRVQQVCAVLLRNSVPLIAADGLLVYAVARDGALWPALAWFVLIEASMLLRRRFAARFAAGQIADLAQTMRRLEQWQTLQGLLRVPIVALAFTIGSAETQLMVTMIMVGLAAGAVASCGGEKRMFRNWSLLALGSLAAGWASHLDWQSATVALLVLYLHRVLAGYVEFLGDQGRRLIEYSAQLEQERDRVHEANVALERIGGELRAERDRAAEANAAKTRVLASVSHDLRQPLFSLSLNTAALGDLLEGSDDLRLMRVEAGLRRSLDQCRGLLDQLVDFSRLESGTVRIHWQAVEVGPFLQSLAATYEPAARAAGLDWQLTLDRRPRFVWSDPLLLERLLGNLLQNAVKFTPSGRVGLRMGDASAGRVGIEVVDTGPGIPADQQQRVFEEFYQLDNPSRDRARGIGLGLSIVRRLAELLGVGVELHSAPGSGCRFALALPASTGSAAAPAAPAPAQVPRSGAATARQPVVLAVDDEPELLADLQSLLGGRGYRMLTATDTAEACVAARRQTPDLVLADFRLRDGHTGLDAVRAVRRLLGREVPALIVTGDTAPHRIAEAAASGLRVLHKPLDGQALALAVQQELDAHQSPIG